MFVLVGQQIINFLKLIEHKFNSIRWHLMILKRKKEKKQSIIDRLMTFSIAKYHYLGTYNQMLKDTNEKNQQVTVNGGTCTRKIIA